MINSDFNPATVIVTREALRSLSEDDIVEGFRDGNEAIIEMYFLRYCRIAYGVWCKRYHLSAIQDMDVDTLTTDYYLYLNAHDWQPLIERGERRASLRTWMVHGFYFIVMAALEKHNDLHAKVRSMPDESLLRSFTTPGNMMRMTIEDFRKVAVSGPREAIIFDRHVVDGKSLTQVAAELGVSCATVTQIYKVMKSKIAKSMEVNYE